MNRLNKIKTFFHITLLSAFLCGTLTSSACALPFSNAVPSQSQNNDTTSQTSDTRFSGSTDNSTNTSSDAAVVTDSQPISETGEARFSDCYYYQTLDASTQKVYAEVYDCLEDQLDKVTVSTTDKDVLGKAFDAVNGDHGDLFWVSGYVYRTYTNSTSGEILSLDFEPNYTMTKNERTSANASIEASATQMLANLPVDADDFEKAKYVFETLIENVDYDSNAAENQNILSVFIYRSTVCQGYACATQYLLEKLGIPSFIVTGTANGENHAWNIAYLDGAYYYIDTTWGNSTFTNGAETSKYINYNYLNVTTQDIHKTHTEDADFDLPECTATADNYFVREGLYFDTWNPDAIGALYTNAWNGDRQPVTVRFSDEALYKQARQYFLEEQKIATYCPGISSLSYMEDATQCVLRISFSS